MSRQVDAERLLEYLDSLIDTVPESESPLNSLQRIRNRIVDELAEQITKWTRQPPDEEGRYWFYPDHGRRELEMIYVTRDYKGKLHKCGEAPDWGPDTRYFFNEGIYLPFEIPTPELPS